jgi:hypothetical protein
MTQLDVLFRYGAPPTEDTAMAINRLREVYGIRRVAVDEVGRTVRIEYDATRLTDVIVQQLLRRAGLDIVEDVPLVALPVPEPPTENVTGS